MRTKVLARLEACEAERDGLREGGGGLARPASCERAASTEKRSNKEPNGGACGKQP